ncbi:hypothetical protein [Phocaeicola plebeius]|uniref:hypothetical protein n=1 Tax=Phocaeicola plebeius TaxID=310297 RepID=UPI0026EB44C9|nr:hypothetical protein [Phocaeicola plebeius]
MPPIASFDIFDTCLIRKCGEANNIFFLLARKLYPTNLAKQECLYHWRKEAETITCKKQRKDNVSLDEIYENYPSKRFIEYSAKQVKDTEILLEEESLIPNTKAISIISQKRKAGYQIIFISDMYLPSSLLQRILGKLNIFKPEDYLFVSCEYNASKRNGNLYQQIKEKIKPTYWEHYGDNYYSDIYQASKYGIKPTLINTSFNKIENIALKCIKENRNQQILSCFIGFIRYTRLYGTDYNSSFRKFSSNFVVPIYCAYVLDILYKAYKENINTLYFLARDGWILHHIAKLFKENFPTIENKYLYVSRKSMYLPSLTSTNEEKIQQYFGNAFKFITINHIISYFKLESILSNNNLGVNFKLNETNKQEFFKWLNQETISAQVLNLAKKERTYITKYFKQEGLLSDNQNYAFVDVGWKGSGLEAINSIMESLMLPKKSCFYWGTFQQYRNAYSNTFYTYNYNLNLPLHIITIIEDYFSASPHLSTIGYNVSNKIVEPIFDEKSKMNNEKAVTANLETVNCFVECLKQYDLIDKEALLILADIFTQQLIHHPENIDLEALSQIQSFEEKRNNKKKTILQHLSLKEVFSYIINKKSQNIWIEGCIYLSYPKTAPYILTAHKVIKGAKNKIKHLIKR